MQKKWLVEGKDVFANEWYAIGRFETRHEAVAAALRFMSRAVPLHQALQETHSGALVIEVDPAFPAS